MTTSARRAGPREHGRQAARSERDRSERAGESGDELSHVGAAAGGGALDPVKPNSATTLGDVLVTLRDVLSSSVLGGCRGRVCHSASQSSVVGLAGVMSVPLVSGVLALASAGCIGMSNFFGGLASRRTSAMSAVIWMELVGVLPALVVAQVTVGTLSWAIAADGLAVGVIAGAGLVCYYRALSVGAMAVAAPLVGAISAAVPVVVGIALGDHLRVLQFVGVVVAVIAIVIVASQGGGSGSKRGIVMAVAAGLLMGVNYFFVKAGSAGGAWMAVLARCSVAAFVALAALVSSTSVVLVRSAWVLVAAAGLCDTLGFLFLIFAYRGGVLSVTTMLASLYPAVAVLLGWVVLHERLRHTQKVGVALALVAVGLIGAG